MRAAVLNESHQLEVAEVADPSPGPGELVLQVTACGICGSDLKLASVDARGARDGSRVLRRDRRHRCRHRPDVATSAATSPRSRSSDAATAWRVSPANPRTASRPTWSVSAAAPARSPSTCASTSGRPSDCPTALDPALGALVEPLAVGLHAVERAHIRSGDNGAGRRRGTGRAVGDRVGRAERRRRARRLRSVGGATQTPPRSSAPPAPIDPESEPLEAALRRRDRVRRAPGDDRRLRRRVQASTATW